MNTKVLKNLLESLKSDTNCTSRQHLLACTSAEAKHQKPRTLKEDIEQDVEAQYQTADALEENTLTQSE